MEVLGVFLPRLPRGSSRTQSRRPVHPLFSPGFVAAPLARGILAYLNDKHTPKCSRSPAGAVRKGVRKSIRRAESGFPVAVTTVALRRKSHTRQVKYVGQHRARAIGIGSL